MAENADEIKTREDGLCAQAAMEGNAVNVAAYLKRGANIHAISKQGYLVQVAAKGHTEVLRVLLDAGADINAPTPTTDVTPLMQAARNGHIGTLQFLLERGASVGATTEQQYHTISWAIPSDNIEVFETLLAQGIDPNLPSESGGTLLMQAARHGSINILKALLTRKPDVNAVDSIHMTALLYARRHRHTGAETILKEAGAAEISVSFWQHFREWLFGPLLRRVHR